RASGLAIVRLETARTPAAGVCHLDSDELSSRKVEIRKNWPSRPTCLTVSSVASTLSPHPCSALIDVSHCPA
ncbi:hypothetical protein, partial [Mesorhizobium sp.]|uniref:hypothetical protein n=1 Tax=Mesorhizobium sp. TaxID=1871066 RepID=UPI0025E30300